MCRILRRSPVTARRVVALVAALVVTAAVLTAALSLTSHPGHVPGSSTTAWQPSQPVSRAVVSKGAHNSPGALRLVSYIEGPLWQKGSDQVPPGLLDCPAVDACYVLAQTVLTTVGPYPSYYNAVYFSGDGGASRSSLLLPPGLEFTTPLSCPSAQTCVGVAYQGDKNELVSTTDGGHQWLISPLRAPADALYLSCASLSACRRDVATGAGFDFGRRPGVAGAHRPGRLPRQLHLELHTGRARGRSPLERYDRGGWLRPQLPRGSRLLALDAV